MGRRRKDDGGGGYQPTTQQLLGARVWDRYEPLTVVKYGLYICNKVALMLFWDLYSRNHKVPMLKILS